MPLASQNAREDLTCLLVPWTDTGSVGRAEREGEERRL